MSDRRILVAFIDAFGPSQMELALGALSFAPHRTRLESVFGYSSGALATVLTGVGPAKHGRMCLFSHKPAHADSILAPLRLLGLLPRWIHERGLVRRVAGKLLARARHLTGYVALHHVAPESFAWLDLPEREDLFTAPDINGHSTWLHQARNEGLTVYAAPWQLPETQRWDHAYATLTKRAPALTFLYSAELDAALHKHGNDALVTRQTLVRTLERVERARDILRSDGSEVTTLLVGDHGMSDVRRAIDPRKFTRHWHDCRVFVDSTLLRMWGSKRALARCRSMLEARHVPGRWLDTGALQKRDVPVFGTPYGAAIFVLEEGVIFGPSDVGGASVRGMHGYDLGSPSTFSALATDDARLNSLTHLTAVAPAIRAMIGLSS